ncbi:MAG: dTMP kinase [Patescibacteria group bacterium]|nr:dTMP kinase [Patescibacteria group bacterium]MBU1870615.1 dTMP kinase [Patescibacteria group bacterium]
MENQKGKFIVIDGTDGSGKATQTEILAKRLRQAGFDVTVADFPQYNTKSAGLVEEYLSGKYGKAEEVGPYRASIFYACDRYDASFKIKKWLAEGKIIISNRYVTANMGHQGGKIENPSERKYYFDWLYKLEYKIFDIPQPDLNIILHVDAEISQLLAKQRQKQDWIGKTNDIHQDNLEHLKKAEKTYLQIAKNFPKFRLIECTANEQILSREEISDLIWKEIIKLFKPAPSLINFKELRNQISSTNIENNDSKLKIEKISSCAKLPTRAYDNDAGLDLYSSDYYSLFSNDCFTIKTGLKLAIPVGCVGLIWDKSGLARNGIHCLAGVIDAGFRGEVTIQLINLSQDVYHIAPGQKIAQLLIQKVEFPEIIEEQVDNETDRKDGHFGSSGLF